MRASHDSIERAACAARLSAAAAAVLRAKPRDASARDITIVLEDLAHFRADAAALRVEKAALWTRLNAEERWGKHRALEIAAWGAVFVVWIAAIAVMGTALGWW